MEIINRKHEEVTFKERVVLSSWISIMDHKQITISSGACREFGIQPNLFIHFINDGDRWYFYCNSDKDGWPLLNVSGKNSVRIANSALIHLFLKRTGRRVPCKYHLQLTGSKKDGNALIEIMLNKPLI